MPANTPEEICRQFRQYMREADIGSALTLYDPEVVFRNQPGEVIKGITELRED